MNACTALSHASARPPSMRAASSEARSGKPGRLRRRAAFFWVALKTRSLPSSFYKFPAGSKLDRLALAARSSLRARQMALIGARRFPAFFPPGADNKRGRVIFAETPETVAAGAARLLF